MVGAPPIGGYGAAFITGQRVHNTKPAYCAT